MIFFICRRDRVDLRYYPITYWSFATTPSASCNEEVSMTTRLPTGKLDKRSVRKRKRLPQRGFTLVELLVVIGIIALLISILLPSLAAAREQGNTIKCLSNLRQLAQAAAMYTSQNKSYLLPADVADANYPVALPYQDYAETWATILVADGYLKYPPTTSTTNPPMEDNVFRCPSGIMEMSAVTFGSKTLPASRLDAQGAMGVLHTSTRLKPNTHVYCWYGINGCSDTAFRTPYTR